VNQNTKIEPASNAIPYLLTIHDTNFLDEEKGASFDFRMKQLKEKIHRSDAIVYVSEFAKTSTHAHFDIPKIPEYVIYNGNNLNNSTKYADAYCTNFVPSAPFNFSIGQVVEKRIFTRSSTCYAIPPMFIWLLQVK